ncbi:MAG: TetR family transcriptional regulator C-terminal domain-containing protein [Bacteroidota bacterium]
MRRKYEKEAILEKGIQLFRERSYHDTGIDDILKTCKIPSGSFYNFFKNKEGFAVAAMQQYNQAYLDYLDEKLNDTNYSPLGRLRNAYQGNLEGNVENQCKIGCLLNGFTSEIAANSEAINQQAVADYQKNNRKLATCIHEGQNIGEIRKDYTAEELADYLINGFMGASTRMKAGMTKAPMELFMKTAFEFLKA